MLLAVLNEEQGSRVQREALSIHLSNTSPGHNVQPLISPSVTIVGASFGVARLDHHLRGLRASVADQDFETFSKLQLLASHLDELDVNALSRFRMQDHFGPTLIAIVEVLIGIGRFAERQFVRNDH